METRQPPPPVLPAPQPVKTEAVKWRVVEVDGEAMFALTEKGYEALARNIADVARWMKEVSYQINFYRDSRKQGSPKTPNRLREATK